VSYKDILAFVIFVHLSQLEEQRALSYEVKIVYPEESYTVSCLINADSFLCFRLGVEVWGREYNEKEREPGTGLKETHSTGPGSSKQFFVSMTILSPSVLTVGRTCLNGLWPIEF